MAVRVFLETSDGAVPLPLLGSVPGRASGGAKEFVSLVLGDGPPAISHWSFEAANMGGKLTTTVSTRDKKQVRWPLITLEKAESSPHHRRRL